MSAGRPRRTAAAPNPSTFAPATDPALVRSRAAVSILFFLNGAIIATWGSRIPAIQAAHHLNHAALGLALLAAAGGAVAAMPLAGSVIAKTGSAIVCKMAVLSYCLSLPFLALAPGLATWVGVLAMFGGAHGALDVAMNAQAVTVEKGYRRPIMSSFHALFSAGGLAGAIAGAGFARFGIAPAGQFTIVAMFMGGAAALAVTALSAADAKDLGGLQGPRRYRLRLGDILAPALIALGAVALCSMLGEGAMADWSALYLREVRHATESTAAAGYAAFSVAMAGVRIAGDRLAARFGSERLIRAGGATACFGMGLALLVPNQWAALAGFAGVGAGFATIVPMVFSATGRLPGLPAGAALATVTSLGYFGFIAGPPLIGLLSQAFGLHAALMLVLATSLLIVALARPALGAGIRPVHDQVARRSKAAPAVGIPSFQDPSSP